jgi:hypothetical protein
MLDRFQSSRCARNGMTAIATHHQIGTDLNLLSFVPCHNSHDAFSLSQKIYSLVLHEKLKRRKPFSMIRKEV